MISPVANSVGASQEASIRPKYLCHCIKVTHSEVRETVELYGCESVEQVTNCCGAGGGCTACHRKIRAFLSARVEESRVSAQR